MKRMFDHLRFLATAAGVLAVGCGHGGGTSAQRNPAPDGARISVNQSGGSSESVDSGYVPGTPRSFGAWPEKGGAFQLEPLNPANQKWDSVAAANAAWADAADSSNGSLPIKWTYNYSVAPDPNGLGYILPAGVAFVPMIFGPAGASYGSEMSDENLATAVANATTGELMAFNEPDFQGEASMTPEQAASYWPRIRATGLRIGAPPTATRIFVSGSWFQQ